MNASLPASEDSRLRRLEERLEITDVVTKLFVFTDRLDWPALKAQVWAPEVTFDMSSLGAGPASKKTPDEIAGMWAAGLGPLQAVHHLWGNPLVTVEGDRANVTCYTIVYHYKPDATHGATRVMAGSYDLSLVRLEEGWRLDGFKYQHKVTDGNATLE